MTRHARPVRCAFAFAVLVVVTLMSACNDDDQAPTAPTTLPVALRGSGDINAVVAEFRSRLGDPLNGVTPGEQPRGRREINWDAVPAAATNTNTFPGDFFNTTSPRGAVFTTPGTGFRVSDNDFRDVNASYAAEFTFFSPTKTFMAVGSNLLDVTFQVAGASTPAAVSGFGVVFSDVEREQSASIELFGSGDRPLAHFAAPSGSSRGLSFVGVAFSEPVVTRVRIRSGDAALGSGATDSSSQDLVIMDDFLYGEPKPQR